MPRKRTSITLDHALAARAGKVLKVDGVSNVIEHCLKEAVRRASLNDLADLVQAAAGPPLPAASNAPAQRRRTA